MSPRLTLVVATIFISASGLKAQEDTLVVDTPVDTLMLVVDTLAGDSSETDSVSFELFSWEEEWLNWCEQSACVSSDTSLWNVLGEPEVELDTAVMKMRMDILDRSSDLDLR